MITRRSCLLVAPLVIVAGLLPFAAGQQPAKPKQETKGESHADALRAVIQKAQEDYRTFFKEPKTALEFWAAASFEIQVGKFDVAAYHFDKLLKLPEKEGDEDLLKIEEAEGLNSFLRLRLIQQWSKQAELDKEARKTVETLIDRVLVALDKKLSDPERITRFIDGLSDKVPEVRSFSLYQLQRTKHRASPLLAEALRTAKGDKLETLKRAMLSLDADIMPPLFELYPARDAKDAADIPFRLNLLWLAKSRLEKRVIPYLWHISSSPNYPKVVADQAKDTLAYLLDIRPDRLPDAKVALTELAEKHYRYQVRWPDITEVTDRKDVGKQLPMPGYKKWNVTPDGRIMAAPVTLRPDAARFEIGMRAAVLALDLDKGYRPAQALFLAFLLEIEFADGPAHGRLDKLVTEKSPPAIQRLLATIDIDLLTTVLERAMAEQNYAVMLPLIDAVGQRGEVRLAQASSGNSPGLLPRLLYYPDARVQFAAARALLKLPASQTPVASTRIVEVLRRCLATDTAPKLLLVFAKDERAAQFRDLAKQIGFESDVAPTVKDALRLLHQSADYDAIVLNDAVPQIDLPYVLSELRADADAGRLPLLLITPQARKAELTAAAAKSRNTFVLPEALLTKLPDPQQPGDANLKQQIEDAIKFAAASETLRKAPVEQRQWLDYEVQRAEGQALSKVERQRLAADALDWFAQMARGELPGYDLVPAKNALLMALTKEDMAVQALRVFARYPTAEAQQRLAGILFDAKKANLHVLAAQELNRHIQKNGLVLNADQIGLLKKMEQQLDLPTALRTELATVVGTLRTTPQMTGWRLLNYAPDPPEPKKGEK